MLICGVILIWFGYTIFLGSLSPFYPGGFFSKNRKNFMGNPGDPQVCPICSIRLLKGELVKSLAFPSITGGRDRLMYIRGCFSCLENRLPRRCPVCGNGMNTRDYLVSRMFERTNTRNHVHVIGCNHCRKMGSLTR
jgi:hypothetical protein